MSSRVSSKTLAPDEGGDGDKTAAAAPAEPSPAKKHGRSRKGHKSAERSRKKKHGGSRKRSRSSSSSSSSRSRRSASSDDSSGSSRSRSRKRRKHKKRKSRSRSRSASRKHKKRSRSRRPAPIAAAAERVAAVAPAAAQVNPQQVGFVTAHEFAERRQKVFKISTGSGELDKLLGGGVESQAITEAFGEFRTGKTQLSHTLAVWCQHDDDRRSYTGGKAIFIDTENTFRPERLRPIGDRLDFDLDLMLDNIVYARARTSEHLMELLDLAAAKFHEEPGVFKLLIVDSIKALFRVDFTGRGELAERQQKLAQMMSRLQKIAEEHNVAVFITNQMTLPKKPIVEDGDILAHASTTRLYLRKGRGENRICKIYDSPDVPDNEATYVISNGGIADAKK